MANNIVYIYSKLQWLLYCLARTGVNAVFLTVTFLLISEIFAVAKKKMSIQPINYLIQHFGDSLGKVGKKR